MCIYLTFRKHADALSSCKAIQELISEMRLTQPLSLNHALGGIAPNMVSGRRNHVRIPDVSLSFLLYTSFRNEVMGKKINFCFIISQGLLSVSLSVLQ